MRSYTMSRFLTFWAIALATVFSLNSTHTLEGFNKAYVSNSNGELSVINSDANIIASTVTLKKGTLTAGVLQGIAISNDGDQAFVVDNTNGGVWVLNTIDESVQDFIKFQNSQVTTSSPLFIAISPTKGALAYVTDQENDIVWVLNTNTLKFGWFALSGPYAVAFNPSGTKVYFTQPTPKSVSIYKTANQTFLYERTFTADPGKIAINADGIAYVTIASQNLVEVIDTNNDDEVTGTLAVGDTPTQVAFTPNGGQSYIGNTSPNSLSVVLDGVVMPDPIDLDAAILNDIAFSLDGNKAYVVLSKGSLIPSSVTVVGSDGNIIPSTLDGFNQPNAVTFLRALSGPNPPRNFIARKVKNKCGEFFTELAWLPSTSNNIVGYLLFRNDVLIANIPAEGPFFFLDKHCSKEHGRIIYLLQAVNNNGLTSSYVFVVVNHRKCS